jgi:hypothetical protein
MGMMFVITHIHLHAKEIVFVATLNESSEATDTIVLLLHSSAAVNEWLVNNSNNT